MLRHNIKNDILFTAIIAGLITSLIKGGIEHDRYSKLKEKV
jgi:uncharacterized membrane protein YagU involved in acid resistance